MHVWHVYYTCPYVCMFICLTVQTSMHVCDAGDRRDKRFGQICLVALYEWKISENVHSYAGWKIFSSFHYRLEWPNSFRWLPLDNDLLFSMFISEKPTTRTSHFLLEDCLGRTFPKLLLFLFKIVCWLVFLNEIIHCLLPIFPCTEKILLKFWVL